MLSFTQCQRWPEPNSSAFSPASAGIAGVCHHAQLYVLLGMAFLCIRPVLYQLGYSSSPPISSAPAQIFPERIQQVFYAYIPKGSKGTGARPLEPRDCIGQGSSSAAGILLLLLHQQTGLQAISFMDKTQDLLETRETLDKG